MEFKVEGSRRNKKFVEAIMPSIIKQLKLESSQKMVMVKIEDEIPGNEGLTLDLSESTGVYLVVLRPRRYLIDLAQTIAHEMVHVSQMAKGKLKTKGKFHYWCGKKYTNKTKYLDRPWEIDAFAKQEIIMRRALEE